MEPPSWCITRSTSLGKTWSRPASHFPAGFQKLYGSMVPTARRAPAQLEDGKVIFLAKAPSVGYAVYHVLPAAKTPLLTEPSK